MIRFGWQTRCGVNQQWTRTLKVFALDSEPKRTCRVDEARSNIISANLGRNRIHIRGGVLSIKPQSSERLQRRHFEREG
jgi:hypothetical protein